MRKHPRTVEGFRGSLEQLAIAIGNMTYDQTSSFIGKLADDIRTQADADDAKGKSRLASELYASAEKRYEARERMDAAWKICEPYMID